MKPFIKKTLVILIVYFLIVEIFSRLLIDPVYFYHTNTYNDKKNKSIKSMFENQPTEHADFVFIGSSRIPATINPTLFNELSNGIVINAGRGYMTPGIHYQAIKNKLKNYPDFLQNSVVLIEYVGSDIYTSAFEEDMLKVYEPAVKSEKSMTHLLLPHLDFNSFFSFLTKSHNSMYVKAEMTVLLSSTYRACQFINEKFNSHNSPLFQTNYTNLVSEGGIRNDKTDFAIQSALNIADQQKEEIKNRPPLTFEIINKSSFYKLYEIIKNNGGTLMVYEMPLHSSQNDLYSSEKAQKDKVVFETWLKEKNITIIFNPDFKYTDVDFPDTWHLSKDRRDEFTSKLYFEITKAMSHNRAASPIDNR